MLPRFMHFAINCTNGRNPKSPKLSRDMMEPFVKIIFIVATALKAQRWNEPFEDYGKARNGKVRYSESVREKEKQDRSKRHFYLTGSRGSLCQNIPRLRPLVLLTRLIWKLRPHIGESSVLRKTDVEFWFARSCWSACVEKNNNLVDFKLKGLSFI
jgi:hypothetical protein